MRNAVKDAIGAREPLGRRLRARFVGIGLVEDLPEPKGELARPATFEE